MSAVRRGLLHSFVAGGPKEALSALAAELSGSPPSRLTAAFFGGSPRPGQLLVSAAVVGGTAWRIDAKVQRIEAIAAAYPELTLRAMVALESERGTGVRATFISGRANVGWLPAELYSYAVPPEIIAPAQKSEFAVGTLVRHREDSENAQPGRVFMVDDEDSPKPLFIEWNDGITEPGWYSVGDVARVHRPLLVFTPTAANRIWTRAQMPGAVTGAFKGISDDAQRVYMDLGRGDVLMLAAPRFAQTLEAETIYTVVRDGDREIAIENALDVTREREQSLGRTS